MYPQVLASALRAPSVPHRASSRNSSFLLIVPLLCPSGSAGALGAEDPAADMTAVVAAGGVRAEATGGFRRPRLEQEGPRGRQQRESQKGQLSFHDVSPFRSADRYDRSVSSV